MTPAPATDCELVQRARAGEVGALAALLERHRARLHAVCRRVLGPSPEIDDVVHDVFLVALRRLDHLHEPDAAGSWLAGIARNLCLQRMRSRRVVPLELLREAEAEACAPPDVDRLLHDRALADWVWAALTELSEPLRAVVILRYFTRASSYESIAAVLGVPVGTIRSRLSEARRKLVSLLRDHAAHAHAEHAALVQGRSAFFDQVYLEYNRGFGCAQLAAALRRDAVLRQAGTARVVRGPSAITRDLQGDLDAGMRLRVLDVIAGPDLTVLEAAFDNPACDPDHCPPLTTQIFFHHGDAIRAIHLHYAS